MEYIIQPQKWKFPLLMTTCVNLEDIIVDTEKYCTISLNYEVLKSQAQRTRE